MTVRITVPPAVLSIITTLEAAGFEAWCVGGAVRDALMGTADLDWDLATAAKPDQVRRLFQRTVPVGIEHGTIGVIGADGRMYEVTTFRADVKTDGRHATVRFGVSLLEDLARRDLTVNALAWSPTRGELRDPFRGREDLANRVVRAVGDAHQRMAEDRLRALRAIRFAARLECTIADDTWQAIVASAPMLTRLSVERVLQEWTKTLTQVRRPSAAFALWRESGALAALLPALAPVPAVFFDAIDHVPLPAGSPRPERQSLRQLSRLALPYLPLGANAARAALRGLRASNQDIAWVEAVATAWSRFSGPLAACAERGSVGDDVTLRRTAAAIGRPQVLGTLRAFSAVWAARRAAGAAAPTGPQVAALTRRLVRIAYRDPVALSDLAVSGDDLLAAGVPAGRHIGQTLHRLLDLVLDDPSRNSRAELLQAARPAPEGS
jgi:tRNA nucleotidyltransferase (CCA-adding enzyme)